MVLLTHTSIGKVSIFFIEKRSMQSETLGPIPLKQTSSFFASVVSIWHTKSSHSDFFETALAALRMYSSRYPAPHALMSEALRDASLPASGKEYRLFPPYSPSSAP